MSDTNGEYGPRLAAYIDKRRGQTSVREFARQHRLDAARISAWGLGRTPGFQHLAATAEGLGLTIGELLVIMGVGTPDDFTVVDPISAKVPAVADAISGDPDLSEQDRDLLRQVLAMLARDPERTLLREFAAMLARMGQGNDSVSATNATSGGSRTRGRR